MANVDGSKISSDAKTKQADGNFAAEAKHGPEKAALTFRCESNTLKSA